MECRYHSEVRKVVQNAAKVGIGILKGPVPTIRRMRAAEEKEIQPNVKEWTVSMVAKLAPTSKCVSHWNFYPDGNCGENIQDGDYVFERDDITARRLRELKQDPSYIHEMLDMCLEEGPISAVDGAKTLKPGEKVKEHQLFEIWYYHGMVSKKDMEAAGCRCEDDKDYPAIATMVNDRIIKVTLSPLDSGEFPYDIMVWQRRTDSWTGDGVGRQMRECQKGANAGVRNLMDNAALSAGPQIVIDRSKIIPANGRWELTPRKVWYTKVNEEVADVTKAFMIVSIETRQVELMNMLHFWLKEAEDVTGLPMLLQGQQGSASDTLGGMQILNNNGSTVMRKLAKAFDDLTEPHINRYYEWLLLHGPQDAKGDFTINARGSSALVERDQQAQQLVQIIALSLNPAYGLNPELVIREFLTSLRFDVDNFVYTDEEKQTMASQPQPEDPRIAAAKITAQSRAQVAQAGLQGKQMQLQSDAQQSGADRNLAKWIAEVDAQLRSAALTAEERQHLDDIKATLAGITMKLTTTQQMASADRMTPVIEPPGRAPDGQAFER